MKRFKMAKITFTTFRLILNIKPIPPYFSEADGLDFLLDSFLKTASAIEKVHQKNLVMD